MKKLSLYICLCLFLIGFSGCDNNSALENNANESSLEDEKLARILNGEDADPDDYPWMVAIFPDDKLCGGSLIDSKWIVTAAHCIDGVEKSDIKVLLGTHDLKQGGKIVDVKRYIIHPDYYDALSLDSDIALIELKEHISFSTIDIISLDNDLDKKSATTTGWGRTSTMHPFVSQKLQQVTTSIISNEECSNAYKEYKVTENMLCAGKYDEIKGTYYGDSGGPLMIKNGNDWELVGITSWGSPTADNYDVYTRVSKFKKWITSNINNTKADLTPQKRPDWLSPLIINKKRCSLLQQCVGDDTFKETDELYASWSIKNIGGDLENINNMRVDIYIDNLLIYSTTIDIKSLNNNKWTLRNAKIGTISAGVHTIKMIIDADNDVTESDETNNEYSYTFTVGDIIFEAKDADYYIEKFYNQHKSFFAAKSGGAIDCGYPDWMCQNFTSGKKISAQKDTYALEWWDGSKWHEYGLGSEIYTENKTDIKPIIKYNVDKLYKQKKGYFGTRFGDIVPCYENWMCQNFTNGKRISIHTSTHALEFWDGSKWNEIW